MSRLEGSAAHYLLGPDHALRKLQRGALVVGLLGAGLSVAGAFASRQQFYHSYLVAFLFWLGPALGSLGILMLQHITGGRWGVALRRILEAGARTLPLMALLFLPVVAGMHSLYEWTNTDLAATDAVLRQKQLYLNVPFFLARAAVYFTAWILVSYYLCRWSLEQDAAPTQSVTRRLQNLSRGGLALYILTMTFAAFDWGMSLDPHWYSHIYGILLIIGQVLSAMAFAIVIADRLADRAPISDFLTADRFHDFGNLLLAFVMLWAYFAFSQYLIVWAADLPAEIPWYVHRLGGGWETLGLTIILFHFAVPFLLLLSRIVKRNPRTVATVAVGLLLLRLIDVYWTIAPTFHPGHFALHWLDLATVAGMGGLWVAAFIRKLDGKPVLPLNDPYLLEGDDA